MSQLISNLSADTIVNISENGILAQYIIRKSTANNPYGNDKVLMERKYLLPSTTYGSNYKYPDSKLDNYLSNFGENNFSDSIKSNIATVSIVINDFVTKEEYTIARKFFAPSRSETISGKRYFESNTTSQNAWTRDAGSENTIYHINTSGGFAAHTVASNFPCLFMFNLYAKALVSSIPNEDGSYNLLPSDNPKRAVDFHTEMGYFGGTGKKPKAIKVEVASIGNPVITAWACNDYNEIDGSWEEITLGEEHVFENTIKPLGGWEIGVKIHAEAENSFKIFEPAAMVVLEEEE